MPLLGFQERFEDDVEAGRKRQTVRREWKRPIKVGDRLYLYGRLRTKQARKLGEAICISVEPIAIHYVAGRRAHAIFVSGVPLSDFAERKLARADGFDDTGLFVSWFRERYGLPFRGVIVKWSPLK